MVSKVSGWILPSCIFLLLTIAATGSDPVPPPAAPPVAPVMDETPGVKVPPPRPVMETDPFTLVSVPVMLANLQTLTGFGADGLWRTSGSAGERQAFVWLRERLGGLEGLKARGAEVERQTFRIPLATEVWESRLELEIDGIWYTVPVHAMQGHREILTRTLRFDTDGQPGDTVRNPVTVLAAPRIVRTYNEMRNLGALGLQGRVALIDYAVFDRGLMDLATAQGRAAELLNMRPAAIVLITSYSNRQGLAHGSFAGDVSGFAFLDAPAPVPTAFTRMEDLGPAGVYAWSGLSGVARARLRLDVDVLSPGDSELTCLHIPGLDSSHAVILGAHLDSPNSPGAMDDGGGSVALLEAARALDAMDGRPPVDLCLCWFGSHERGLYGSTNFVSAHQELLDRTIGMLQADCLGHAVEGLQPELYVEQWSYSGWGDPSIPLPDYLAAAAALRGDTLRPLRADGVTSDNSSFTGFDVPSANLILMDPYRQYEVHVDNHLHDPYDTVELASQHSGELAAMARAFLSAALQLGGEKPGLRVTPPPRGRAVFVASHTEQPHMTPAAHTLLGMALAREQLDVDVIPYGQAVTPAGLAGAALVIVLPVLDYPAQTGPHPYDEGWTADEVAALRGYAEGGGLLVLASSTYRLRQPNTTYDLNEDWPDINLVSTTMGITYTDRPLAGGTALVVSGHDLVQGVASLALAPGNGKAISAPAGQVLARTGADTAVSLVPAGPAGGEVLALGDLGILGHQANSAANVPFWHNLARYARLQMADLNGDNSVNVADWSILADLITERRDRLPWASISADVNRDGTVDVLDLLAIASAIQGN